MQVGCDARQTMPHGTKVLCPETGAGVTIRIMNDTPDSPTAVREMRERHMRLGMQLQALAVVGLEQLQAKIASGQAPDMTPDECRSLAAVGLELGNSALPVGRIASKKPC